MALKPSASTTASLQSIAIKSLNPKLIPPSRLTQPSISRTSRQYSNNLRTSKRSQSINYYSTKSSSSNQQQEDLPAGISPWARFMDVLKAEYAKSQEIQENIKELSGTAQGIKDSEAAQKMRKAYTAMRLETLIRENPKLASMAQSLSTTGRSVSDAVNRVATEIEESRLVQAARRMSRELDKRIGEPIRQTEVYKSVSDTVDFSQGALRYGGYIEKAERVQRRQKRLERLAKLNQSKPQPSDPSSSTLKASSSTSASSSSSTLDPSSSQQPPDSSSPTTGQQSVDSITTSENPKAPPALILHPTANQENADETSKSGIFSSIGPNVIKELWQSVQDRYNESENPMISSLRTVTGFIKRNVFDETETARVIRLIKEVDPSFNYDQFLADLREFIIPDFIDSFVDNDLKSLQMWTSEAAFNVTSAPMKMYLQRGLRPGNQIIDLKGIDIISAKVLEERDLPVFIVGFKTHEINCYINPNKKTTKKKDKEKDGMGGYQVDELDDQVEVGSREEIQQVHYVVILTKAAHLNSSSPSDEKEADEDEPEPKPNQTSSAKSSDPGPKDEDVEDVTGGWKIIDLARRSSVAFL